MFQQNQDQDLTWSSFSFLFHSGFQVDAWRKTEEVTHTNVPAEPDQLPQRKLIKIKTHVQGEGLECDFTMPSEAFATIQIIVLFLFTKDMKLQIKLVTRSQIYRTRPTFHYLHDVGQIRRHISVCLTVPWCHRALRSLKFLQLPDQLPQHKVIKIRTHIQGEGLEYGCYVTKLSKILNNYYYSQLQQAQSTMHDFDFTVHETCTRLLSKGTPGGRISSRVTCNAAGTQRAPTCPDQLPQHSAENWDWDAHSGRGT